MWLPDYLYQCRCGYLPACRWYRRTVIQWVGLFLDPAHKAIDPIVSAEFTIVQILFASALGALYDAVVKIFA